MPQSGGSRITQEMSKRPTPTTPIPETPSLKQKRTSSSLAAVQTTRVSEILVKNQPTQIHSPARKGGGKPSQRGHSRNQNAPAKKASSDRRGKLVGSPGVQPSSRNGKRKNGSYVDNGSSSEVFYDATDVRCAPSSSAGHQEGKDLSFEAKYAFGSEDLPLESKYAEMRISSDHGSKSTCDDGDMSSSGKTLSEDSQCVEIAPSLLLEVVRDDPQGVEPLLSELMDDVIGRLSMAEVMQLRSELGKAFRNAIHRPAFLRNRPRSEGEFSPSYFMTDDGGDLHWYGFDTKLRKWTRLPSLNFAKEVLPSPDPDLFKDYLVAGDGGLLCINVGKASGREKLVICNPLTQQIKVLPPLNYPRHPVLMHLKVDHDSGHYKVFVAGSAAIGTEALSLKTEEYDSRAGVWECPENSDLPCQPFGLNEYQNGVYVKDSERELLICVAIIDTGGRGALVYDITKKKWAQGPNVTQLHIPLVRSEPNVSHLATTQIVECGGSVFVFSEQECGRDVYFLIHKLIPESFGDFTWEEVMKRKRTGGRGLLVYPEFTCVPVSEHELCIFDTVEHTIEVIDLTNSTEVTPLQSAPTSKGNRFHSLNPIGFVFRPSFRNVVCPRGRNPDLRCDVKEREYCSECENRGSDSLKSGGHKNVCHKTTNTSAFVERAGSDAVTVPSKKTDTAVEHVEFFGSAEKIAGRLTQSCSGNFADIEGRNPELDLFSNLLLSK